VAAQDWGGRFTLVPVSAPDMVLEAVQPGNAAGGAVSINVPDGADRQVWLLNRKGAGVALSPASAPHLVLTVPDGGTNNGIPVVIQPDAEKPWQRWTPQFNEDGSLSLLAVHAPKKGLDDFGGGTRPGARQDLWDFHVGDEHLQWVLKPLPGATVPPAFNAPERLDPLAAQGTVKTFSFDQSRIFPGTRRSGTLFIPAQLDASKPACVYVRQDGYNRAEKRVLEALIASGAMPVTVGVFVQPGALPAPMPGTAGRRNRCFEYDAVNDNYVRFLTEELLPHVAREYGLNLSTNGNDRCIAGCSSGGISAFAAAWLRPDAFSRVYANSGSFVAFRGGHEFPTLIRKTDPQPIRAFLTTGTRDMVNCAGDWYLLDQEMDKALQFAGYDYLFRVIDGGHGAGWNECFPDAMRYIWKDWPAPVAPGSGTPRQRDVLLPGEGWSLAADGLADTRGPACNAAGELFFSDRVNDRVYRLGTDGALTSILEKAGEVSALTVGPQGDLFAVSEKTGRLSKIDADGQPRVIAEGLRGRHLLARPDGAFYVSGEHVWHVRDGRAAVVDDLPRHAGGLAYRPDQWLLSVADSASKWVYSYQINDDGTLSNRERFFWLHVQDWEDDAGAESVCYAVEGQMFVATRAGVQICADDGPTQIILPVPDHRRVVGVCIGGAQRDTLYALCGDRIWKRKIKVHAMGAFTPWTSVRGTPL
jgi:enterochelin esterase-like enzyme/sugar lactone lactonase YvrE